MTAETSPAKESPDIGTSMRTLRSLIDCLGQGFLMFDRTGLCGPVYSRACETLLEASPAGRPIADVLRLEGEKKTRFESLMRLAFGGRHAMSFDEILEFAPSTYPHSQGRHIDLTYKMEKGSDGKVEQIVVIATDITEQVRAQTLADERKMASEAVERILHDRQGFGSCIRRALELVDLLSSGRWNQDYQSLLREVHTLKSGAAVFRLSQLTNALHDFESALKSCGEDSLTDPNTARVVAKFRTTIMQESVTVTDHFKELLGLDAMEMDMEGNFSKQAVYGFASYLAKQGLADARRDYIKMVCMESLQTHLRRFDLHLADLAERFNKKIYPVWFTGTDIPFVSGTYRRMLESFIHIFRNIMDHGIELPSVRAGKGKDETGAIEIKMSLVQRGEDDCWLHLEIGDDGAGIDAPKLRAKLMAADANGHWEARSDQEVIDCIFTQSLSTRETVTQYSGRGVGMSAVYHEIKKLGGTIGVRSLLDNGTTFVIDVPYKLDV